MRFEYRIQMDPVDVDLILGVLDVHPVPLSDKCRADLERASDHNVERGLRDELDEAA